MEPTRLYPIIVLFSLVTVEYGGWALLGFITGTGTLDGFRERFLPAPGHAHAGVLLVLSLVYFDYLGRAGYSAACSGWPEHCCWPAYWPSPEGSSCTWESASRAVRRPAPC